MNYFRHCVLLCLSVVLLVITYNLQAQVDDITGDVGGAQAGSVSISGGSSGGVFDSTTSTITHSFNFISLPLTTSTNGQIIIGSEPILHSFGSGNHNVFVGGFAGNFSLTGFENTACGYSALNSLTDGNHNIGIGNASLISLTAGDANIAIGANTAVSLVDGDGNILIGNDAGSAYTSSESSNILISSSGAEGESNTIRIGAGGNSHTDCYIDGIYGVAVDSDSALPSYIDDQGKLGTIVSSYKFKANIKDIGTDSLPILSLRPISFYSKLDKKKNKQFGLIAEEVNKIMPDLVVKDKKGDPYAVRYHVLPVLLLNELQRMNQRVEKLESQLKKALNKIEQLESCKDR